VMVIGKGEDSEEVAGVGSKGPALAMHVSEDILPDDFSGVGVGATPDSLACFLTQEEEKNLSQGQREAWKAKQADLSGRRKDFHGVVTYMFNGIFSWQMYGSADAVDEDGSPYTVSALSTHFNHAPFDNFA
jgi:hypothetical protein